ncbi:MAG: type IV pilus twitching motility protein PilT [Verrucomicrobiae bacterium]|nr:type IV pilus twitching motility protein PilT [Verrucomicrobiae bacterium]
MSDASDVSIEQLLDFMIQARGSDLHITVGFPPACRLNGSIRGLDLPPLKPEDTEHLVKSITSEDRQQQLREAGSVDFGFSYGEIARFRVNVFRQKGSLAMVLRQIPSKLLTLSDVGLPPSIQEVLDLPRGMVLVTGPTGSGKSTTLAAMINFINENRSDHIITIEDPIEYFHPHKRCIVNQREVGSDTKTFADALRRALREDPDVILVGEMRDLETMESAINAAETGHLVFATLHTTGAARTVDRIVGAFPMNQQDQIRIQLAGNLRAVVSQLLLPTADGNGRVACHEIMINNDAIASKIRDNKSFAIISDIQTGSKAGMRSLDQHLVELFRAGLIDISQVMTKCQRPDDIRAYLKG